MHYGIGIPSWINAYQEVQRAEAAGFTHAWFYDSQLIYSDVYAAMALAAHHTSTIKLGTLVAIPSNRIAPVTASAVASLNKLAPGRIILGIGTGYTGRNTMGLPAYPIARYREYAQQVRGLLNGEDVLYTDDVTGQERWIRLIHGQHSEFLNLDDFIPIYVAANGPRAMEVVGQVGDGWVTTGMGLNAQQSFPVIAAAAQAAGRSTEKPYTVGLTSGLVLQDGEGFDSERVTRILGPGMVPGVHAMWEAAYGPGANLGMDNPDLAGEYHSYIREYSAAKGDARGPALPRCARGTHGLSQAGRGAVCLPPGAGAQPGRHAGRRSSRSSNTWNPSAWTTLRSLPTTQPVHARSLTTSPEK